MAIGQQMSKTSHQRARSDRRAQMRGQVYAALLNTGPMKAESRLDLVRKLGIQINDGERTDWRRAVGTLLHNRRIQRRSKSNASVLYWASR